MKPYSLLVGLTAGLIWISFACQEASSAEFQEISEAEARLHLYTQGLGLPPGTYHRKVAGFQKFLELGRWITPDGQPPAAELLLLTLDPRGRAKFTKQAPPLKHRIEEVFSNRKVTLVGREYSEYGTYQRFALEEAIQCVYTRIIGQLSKAGIV